jgi:hypothetical protein
MSGVRAAGDGGVVSSVVGTPKTGASKMAAAAKRGQAGMEGTNPSTTIDEDHPLSDKSLKARYIYLPLHPCSD